MASEVSKQRPVDGVRARHKASKTVIITRWYMGSEVWRQRQEGLYEFEAQQGQQSKFKASWDDTGKRCLKTKQTKSPEVGGGDGRSIGFGM